MESTTRVGDPTQAQWQWEVGEWNHTDIGGNFFFS